MAERIHLIDGGATRLTVRAYKIWWDLGFYLYVAWGGESIRETLSPRPVVWWNPATWGGGSVFVTSGVPTPFELILFDFGGATLPQAGTLAPFSTPAVGYLKREVFLMFWGYPRPIAVDARNVAKVAVRYRVPGEGLITLEQT